MMALALWAGVSLAANSCSPCSRLSGWQPVWGRSRDSICFQSEPTASSEGGNTSCPFDHPQPLSPALGRPEIRWVAGKDWIPFSVRCDVHAGLTHS